MHKIFGIKEKAEYFSRKGAYIIPVSDDKIAVAETPKGLFLLGGGIEPGENDIESIMRECIEEIGCEAHIEKLLCSAEAFVIHPRKGFFHPVQTYYTGNISSQICAPKEPDHKLVWIEYDLLKGRMFSQMQNWAIDMAWNNYNKK